MGVWKEKGILAERKGCERRGLIVLAVIAVGLGLTAAVMAAPHLDFVPMRRNLSETPGQDSIYPDLATSPDGEWMVAAWVEREAGDVYLRAASLAGSGWGETLPVFAGASSKRAYDAAVVVTDEGDAYVAYVLFELAGSDVLTTEVGYAACLLAIEPPGCKGYVSLDQTTGGNETITWVDLALGAGASPHVVWARFDQTAEIGEIYYNGGGASEKIGGSGDYQAPAIAWADGDAHIVWWEDGKTGGGTDRIWYSRPLSVPETLGQVSSSSSALGHPAVAAGVGRVFVAWEQCTDVSCERYNLVYRRSNDQGGTWEGALEVGTDETADMIEYRSLRDPQERPEYLLDLQPSIALNSEGWPAVAWHADRSGGAGTDYAIHYTYAVTGTPIGGVEWLTTTVLSKSPATARQGSTEVGVRELSEAGQYLHIVYMQSQSEDEDWDVYYDSSAEEEEDGPEQVFLPLVMRNSSQ